MSRYYGMSYRDVMAMPIKTFWAFNNNIGRLQAEADLRLFQVYTAHQSKSGGEYLESLTAEYGQPLVAIDNRRDSNANSKLRELLT